MKRIVFLIIASLLMLGLVLPGCGGGAANEIIIGIAGPLTNVQGVHMLNGALLAAKEINAANGVNVGGLGTNYTIKIVSRDTDEINNPASAAPAVQYLISNKKAQFIIGGFRTEAVSDVITSVILDEKVPFFITGAATYSLLNGMPLVYGPTCKGTPYYPYPTSYPDSAGYKYVFRATPFNDVFLVNNCFLMFEMVAKAIQDEMGWTGYPWANKVRVAVVAEDLAWTTPMLESVQAIIGGYGTYFGWEFADNITGHANGEWLVNDKDEPSMTTFLNQIEDADAQVIFTILSGPVGVQFGTLKGELDIPAVVVGINVESQDPGYWSKTDGNCEYEVSMSTWAPGMYQTSETEDFFTAYDDEYGLFPLYTAASYDMVYSLKAAFETTGVGTDKDKVVAWLEDVDKAQLGAAGVSAFYPPWDSSTQGMWKGYAWPALNPSQIADFYDTGTYTTGCNFTMPPYSTHDLVYGPWWTNDDPTSGWQTGIAVQWMASGTTGDIVGIWPNSKYGPTAVGTPANLPPSMNIINTISRAVSGLNWTDMEYTGVEDITIPPAWVTAWGG